MRNLREPEDSGASQDIGRALGVPIQQLSPAAIPARRMFGGASMPTATAVPASHPLLSALGKLWASPNTVLGLAAAGTSYLAGKMAGTSPQFQLGNNAIQLLNSPLNIHNRAYTLGNVQVYGVNDGPDRYGYSYTGAKVNTGRHEEGHTYQAQLLGPLYLPAEAIESLRGDRNSLEVGADKYALGQSWAGF